MSKVFIAELVIPHEGSIGTTVFSTEEKALAFVPKEVERDTPCVGAWVVSGYVVDEDEVEAKEEHNDNLKNYQLWNEEVRTLVSFTMLGDKVDVGIVKSDGTNTSKKMTRAESREYWRKCIVRGYTRVR